MAEMITEEEADTRFDLKKKLASGGDYGCHVLVFKAGDPEIASRDPWMCDVHFRSLWTSFAADSDIGTIIIDGDVTLDGAARVSDRLMCLVVTGDFSGKELSVFETEVLVCGDVRFESLTDRDGYLTVLGKRLVG